MPMKDPHSLGWFSLFFQKNSKYFESIWTLAMVVENQFGNLSFPAESVSAVSGVDTRKREVFS